MKRLSALGALVLLYAVLVQTVPDFGYQRWQLIAAFNSVLAIILWFSWKPRVEAAGWLKPFAWSLGPLVLAGTIACLYLSEQGESEVFYSDIDILLLCFVIPIVEEIIFRRTIYDALSRQFPKSWSIYLSAFLFALAHSDPLHLSMPVGPFLVGLLTAYCYQATGRLAAAVVLHSACNGAAILIALYSPTWLESFSWLYQRL